MNRTSAAFIWVIIVGFLGSCQCQNDTGVSLEVFTEVSTGNYQGPFTSDLLDRIQDFTQLYMINASDVCHATTRCAFYQHTSRYVYNSTTNTCSVDWECTYLGFDTLEQCTANCTQN